MSNLENSIDPVVPSWNSISLSPTWPDALDFRKPRELVRFFKSILGDRKRVELPDELMGKDLIPTYALQEFHSLPNGNYSNNISAGYVTGFDLMMLNKVDALRERLADSMENANSVLDLGCSGGKTAAAVKRKGVNDVWGLDISPYLLKHAAACYDDIHFLQACAEKTGFSDQRFDGITACFLFHEIPPKYADRVLMESYRILKPGGILAFAEPSSIQLDAKSYWDIFRKFGFVGIYFRWLAKFVYEPFVPAWHKRDIPEWLDQHGFELLENDQDCPAHVVVAKKR